MEKLGSVICSEACQQINCTHMNHKSALPTQLCNSVTRLTTLARTPPHSLPRHMTVFTCVTGHSRSGYHTLSVKPLCPARRHLT